MNGSFTPGGAMVFPLLSETAPLSAATPGRSVRWLAHKETDAGVRTGACCFDSFHCEKSGQAGLAMTNYFASAASKTGFSSTGLPPM